jgi:hypothetical protein
VNGQYVSTGAVYNARLLYRQVENPGRWLRYTTDKQWTVSRTAGKDANNCIGWAHCIEQGLDNPDEAKRWSVHNGNDWVEQASVRVVQVVCIGFLGRIRAIVFSTL